MSVDLSVVIIARNEENRIASSIDSCLRSVRLAIERGLVRSVEVVVSDSCSSDRTIEIAMKYPVTVVQLRREWPRSAAAGRQVGFSHTSGDLVLFVDGDFHLSEAWLQEALGELRRDPGLAAVSGRILEDVGATTVLGRRLKEYSEALTGSEPEAVPIGLYRRSAYDLAGGMNPFLLGGEDRELAHRLRLRGFRFLRLEALMGIHGRATGRAFDYLSFFRSAVVWSIGDGQTARIHVNEPSVRRVTRHRYADLSFLRGYLVALLLALLTLANISILLVPVAWFVLLLDGATLTALFVLQHRRGWSWKEFAYELHVAPYVICRHAGFVVGFLLPRPDPRSYPMDAVVLRQVPPITERSPFESPGGEALETGPMNGD